jgi:membrane-associated phospholipid phosphatase
MYLQDPASPPAATSPEGRPPFPADGWLPDPTRPAETAALTEVQRRLDQPRVIRVARGLSHVGEHAGGWLAFGALAAAVDRPRRREWLHAAAAVAFAHGASIGVKRVVRRPRPNAPEVDVRVSTPSRLSFPSSHACSTTAAAVAYGRLLGPGWTARLGVGLVAPMMLSRVVLGVHFPTDVLAGSLLGAVSTRASTQMARRLERRRTR